MVSIMTKPIRLNFFRSSSGKINFGDELSPEIVKYVSRRKVVKATKNKYDLIAIGSILESEIKYFKKYYNYVRATLNSPVYVWGSGLILEKSTGKPTFQTLALRGKLTKYNLGIKQAADIAMGDPALFVNDMMRLKPKRSGIGIVPHYSDKTHPIINNLKNIKNVKVIDVERCGSDVCHDIASCDFIVSSSLHGLVVADSFRIPNYRIKLFDNLKGGDFKFRDYASALKRKNINEVEISTPEKLLNIKNFETDFNYQSNIDDICSKLERALKEFF